MVKPRIQLIANAMRGVDAELLRKLILPLMEEAFWGTG